MKVGSCFPSKAFGHLPQEMSARTIAIPWPRLPHRCISQPARATALVGCLVIWRQFPSSAGIGWNAVALERQRRKILGRSSRWLRRTDGTRSKSMEVAVQLSTLDATDVSAPKQQDRKRIRIPRVAIVRTGFVGSTTAYALLISGTAAEIALIDRDRRRAEGHVQDLRDAELFSHNTRIFPATLPDCSSANLTTITTGVSQSDSKSRLDGLRETAAILKGLVQGVSSHNPHGILLIASNPVDVLTYAAWTWSGLPASRVIGSGTTLDTSRFRRRLAERYGVASDNVHAYIIGEHGDTQVPVISSARIAGVPLENFCRELGVCDE